jgi:S1-C subfamily serine protease
MKRLLLAAVLILMAISFLACGSSSSTTQNTNQNPSPQLVADFTTAVEKALPSVVIIEVDLGAQGGAAGTGWLFDANGHIVTNAHVIAGAQSITVTLNDGRKFTATGSQSNTDKDIAVVKINAQNLTAASIGDSSSVKMGQAVAAIGNSLDLGLRVTAGVASRLDVSITYQNNLTINGCIETDAVLNPGNSGGVLIDTSGNVIGITNATLEGPNTDVEGFDYAISINEALPVINSLVSKLP